MYVYTCIIYTHANLSFCLCIDQESNMSVTVHIPERHIRGIADIADERTSS